MKKVVERVQRENETLKKSSAPANQHKVAALEQENEKLKVVGIILCYTSYILVDKHVNLFVVTTADWVNIVVLGWLWKTEESKWSWAELQTWI